MTQHLLSIDFQLPQHDSDDLRFLGSIPGVQRMTSSHEGGTLLLTDEASVSRVKELIVETGFTILNEYREEKRKCIGRVLGRYKWVKVKG